MATTSTIDLGRSPLPVRLFNSGVALAGKLLRSDRALLADDLIKRAQRRTALEDFGGEEFREPLTHLLESCHRDAQLNAIGKLALRADVLRHLENRLLLQRDRTDFPEIAQQEIRAPLFIVGLPRSGTTLLHSLLAEDPDHRAPLTWEVMEPSPPTRQDEHGRIRRAQKNLAWLRRLAPTFPQVHALGAELPQECVSLMSVSFMSDQFDTMFNVPSYRGWFFQRDLTPAYAWHRRFLQQLQQRRSGTRWILKAPAHMFALPTLLSVYPDACFVQAHRAPLETIASVSSLITILRRVFSDDVDPAEIGRDALHYWHETLTKFLHARETLPAERIFDLSYLEIRRDPIAAVRSVYEHFGWNFSHQAATRMRTMLANQPSEEHGQHRYELAQFGLDAVDAAELFAPYCEQFDLFPHAVDRAGERAA